MGSKSNTTPHSSKYCNVKVKKEVGDEEIKEYAETAMNELLGWYGYDKVDSRDTQGLNLQHFASQRSPDSDGDLSDLEEGGSSSSHGRRDDLSSHGSPPLSDGANIPAGYTVCTWCQKVTLNSQLFTPKTPNGHKAFCSEVCFTQCRRANFKKNKTCDWCRHVRHTVNYVDFQDGEHQLQFCSDKCLNQYKMNIFCKETQAHLQMHPHLQEGSGSAGALITPDLWMRDCRSSSPSSDKSSTPPPLPPKAATPVDAAPPAKTPPPQVQKKVSSPPISLGKASKRGSVHSKKSEKHKRTQLTPSSATITLSPSPVPTDLRTTSISPVNSIQKPLPHLNPIVPSHLLPSDHPLPRHFLPPGLLPHPNMYPDPHLSRFPLLRPPPPSSPPHHLRLPQLLPLPHLNQRPRLPQPPPPPPPPSLANSLLPPVTVMVPYPILLPIPIPIPIPIPLFASKPKTEESNEDTNKKSSPMMADTPQPPAVTLTPIPKLRIRQGKAVSSIPSGKSFKENKRVSEDSPESNRKRKFVPA